jgi:hypothetical protein
MGARAGKPRETMQTRIDELLALQRADGGWSQTVPELSTRHTGKPERPKLKSRCRVELDRIARL